MQQKIFLAGASGAVGRVLAPMLVAAGYQVFGTSRQAARAAAMQAAGVTPVIVDVFDRAALAEAVAQVAPDAVIHQLTDLPANLEPALMAQAVVRNARIRDEGTRNLVEATIAAGCRRMIAQSIAWAYAPAGENALPYTEESPLDRHAEGTRRISVDGVIALERQVLAGPAAAGSAGWRATVLRYGQLYGPGTGSDHASGASPVHVEAAAAAALLVLQQDRAGIFNITEDGAAASNARARRELGWQPQLRHAASLSV